MFHLDPEGLGGTEMFMGEEVWRRGRRSGHNHAIYANFHSSALNLFGLQ